MSKHNLYHVEPPVNPMKKQIHPIWRGIGCITVIIVPAISYGIAVFLFNSRQNLSWFILPQELVIQRFNDPYILVKVFYAALITFILGALLTAVTFFINRVFGFTRFGPYDVPPEEVTKQRRF